MTYYLPSAIDGSTVEPVLFIDGVLDLQTSFDVLDRGRDKAHGGTGHDARNGMTDRRELCGSSCTGDFGILYTGGRKGDD